MHLMNNVWIRLIHQRNMLSAPVLIGAWLCLCIIITSPQPCVSEDVTVRTAYGALRGRRVSTGGGTGYLDTFFGIPFAQPPVGHLRFKPPEPISGWTGTRDATRFSSICPQPPFAGLPQIFPINEDCLYLNVYAPKPPSDQSRMPVMVWIHGGSYRTGCGAYYNGSELASKGVVVVTINYRLGALGFLSTLDAASGGNYGLLDQIQALKWVKDTIASFHGDPNDVTIFGESAGSSSVSLLRLSPLAQGLFSKAIMESGVSLSPWAVALPSDSELRPLDLAQELARRVNCGPAVDQGTDALVQCLRNISVGDIGNVSRAMFTARHTLATFRPTVETVIGVLPDTPSNLLARGLGNDITSIRGVNKDEYSVFLIGTPLASFTAKMAENTALSLAQATFPEHSETVAGKIMEKYFPLHNLSTPEQVRTGFVQLMSDFDFIVPTVIEQRRSVTFPGHARQFLYEFTYRATHTTVPAWSGVRHGEELPFVFGQPFTHDRIFENMFPFNWTTQDETMSMNFLNMWTNFAKFGNPTPQAVGGVVWSPYTMVSQSYLDIGSSLVMQTNLDDSRVQFWLSIMNSF